MNLPRRRFLHLAAGIPAVLAAPHVARAQNYPARPLRFLVGFPAGGGADTVVRIIVPWLSDKLGQQIIVENRPGASTGLAIQAAVNSPPDGHTLVHFGASSVVNSIMHSNLPFDLQRDIALVAGLVEYPMVLVVNPSFSAKSVADLIAEAKANPGKLTMASFGTGSASHLAGELFKLMAGVNMVHVPYRGGAPMIADLVGGQVQIGFDVMTTSLPQIRAGKLRALAVLGTNQFELLPGVPTVGETVPGYEARTWAGVAVPRRTPPEIIARLNRHINEGLADPTIKARLAEAGTVPLVLSAAKFSSYFASEFEKWAKVVKFAGIKTE
jgi:tripartite-type tricarboxylate transporter receptor subunit TctC